jgi:hypothetical protein
MSGPLMPASVISFDKFTAEYSAGGKHVEVSPETIIGSRRIEVSLGVPGSGNRGFTISFTRSGRARDR